MQFQRPVQFFVFAFLFLITYAQFDDRFMAKRRVGLRYGDSVGNVR